MLLFRAIYAISNSILCDINNAMSNILRDLCTKAISPACCVKIVLNRSFISINSLIPCVFALPESEIIFRAKVSLSRYSLRSAHKHILHCLMMLLIAGSLVSACSPSKKEEDTRSAEELYAVASEQMSKKNWKTALEALKTLEAKYPYGVHAEQAQLDTIYAYYRSEQSGFAIAAADRFIKLHPTHRTVDYAYYLKGLASFSENTSLLNRLMGDDDWSDRDVSVVRNALIAFEEVYTLFPDSQYALDSRIRARKLLNALSQHEIVIANYYYTQRAYVAVANRAKGVIENYPTTPAMEQALALLTFSYENMGLTDLASDTRRILALNFPHSGYLNETIDTVKFFNKYSPDANKPNNKKKSWFSSWF